MSPSEGGRCGGTGGRAGKRARNEWKVSITRKRTRATGEMNGEIDRPGGEETRRQPGEARVRLGYLYVVLVDEEGGWWEGMGRCGHHQQRTLVWDW